jgi:hypothetical protein
MPGDRSSSGPSETKDKDRDGQNARFRTTGGRSLLHDEPDVTIPSPALTSRSEPAASPVQPIRPVSAKRSAVTDFVLRSPPPPKRHPPPHRLTYPLSHTSTASVVPEQSSLSAPAGQANLPSSNSRPHTLKHAPGHPPYSVFTPAEAHGRARHPRVSGSPLTISRPDGPFGARFAPDGSWPPEGSLVPHGGRFTGPFGEAARGGSITPGTSKYQQSSAALSPRRNDSLSFGQSIVPDGPMEAGTMGWSREIDDERRKLLTRTDLPRITAADAVPVDMRRRDRVNEATGSRGAASSVNEPKMSSRVSAFFSPPVDHQQQGLRQVSSREFPFASPPPTGPSDPE